MAALLVLLFFNVAGAQATAPVAVTASVTGRISNAGTNAYLEGAVVTLEPGGRTELTNTAGEFVFSSVPPGNYTVTANYTGLDSKSTQVSVGANGRGTADLALTSGIYQLDTFVVAGEREGNAAAITQQRNADNVRTVMASDAFGNVADANIGTFIMRMPGVTKFEQEGDVTTVMIRGMSEGLSMVTLDGEQGSSASPLGGMKRGFEMDKISADFIESIEVSKSLTPDMDAGAVGGVVNLKTKSALARKGRHVTFQVGEAYNVWRGTMRPFASFSYSDVLGADQKLGVLLTMNYNQTNKPRDNSNFSYEPTTDTDRPIWFNANPWGEDWTNHTRKGISGRFDYRLTPVTTVFASVMYSHYHVTLDRRRGGINNPTVANLVQVTNKTSEARNHTFTYTQQFIERTVVTSTYMIGGETRLLGGKLDFQATYSPSDGHQTTFNTPRTVTGVQLRQDRSISHNYAVITQTGGPDMFDPRNTLLNVNIPTEDLTDRVYGAQVNLTRNLELKWPLGLKVGGRYRSVRKTNDEGANNNEYVGPNGVAGPRGALNDDDLSRFFDPKYHHKAFLYPTDRMPFFDGEKIKRAMVETPEYFRHNLGTSLQNSLTSDTELTEDIAAAYVMGTLKVSRLTAVGGVRFEDTRLTGSGYKTEISREEAARRAAWVGPLTDEEITRRTLAQYGNFISTKAGYDRFFPSLNLKYAFRPNFVARFGFSESIGRPPIGSIRPTISVNVTNETLTANNPALKPQSARNFDVSLEYYFKSTGLVSVGAFRKDLDDFIFRSTLPVPLQPGNPYGDDYVGYELTTSINGGTAWVRGLEFAYQQQLSDLPLPRLLRPLGFFANFTWLQTQGNYNDPSGVASSSAVPGFTPRSGNIGVSWIGYGWTVRVKGKYEGDRLRSYNANPAQRIYTNENFPIDLNLAYTINRRLSAFVDVINVFDSRTFDDYIYVEDRPLRTFKFSTYVKFGVSGRF